LILLLYKFSIYNDTFHYCYRTLYSNVISTLRGSVFNRTSVGGRLDMTKTSLQAISGLAFNGLTYVKQM